ncbi:MAG: AAA family ATPase [Planctomycetes bacterium]|nr:AAA family ATPase [Planctomycetota bacterium]
MPSGDDALEPLRAALRVSPDNIPLRRHLADTLLALGRADEAAKEYRAALAQEPANAALKIGLATAFYHQGKDSAALVIVEDLIKADDTPGRAYVLHARLLVKAGDVERAVRQYKKGSAADPAAADPEFASRLGITPDDAPPRRTEEDEVVDGRVRGRAEGSGAPPDTTLERPAVSFKDVGGMDALKEEIKMKIIYPLLHPEMYKAYGKAIGGGILMYGPPGCGKTHLARATAGEVKAGFIAVGINDVLDMWIGQSERNLHETFQRARDNKPCVLFFDEVDALGASRTDMRQSAGRQLINQFLSEMDGIASANDGVLILAATNAPWHLDSAFRRPGRFDRILFVPPPDAPARAAVLRILCKGKPLGDLDYDHVADKAVGFSGADLKSVVDVAIEKKLRDAMREGVPKPLATRDLLDATATLKPSTKEWFATARNYALYSNQGGIYDDILKFLKL